VDNAVAPVHQHELRRLRNVRPGRPAELSSTGAAGQSEGITWLAAAGDNGATDCDAGVNVAENGLAVDEPGSIPEVTSMGGTR
jgi:hypothetical protein